MVRQPTNKKGPAKAGPKRKKLDTTVPPISLSFEDAVKALLGTPPPGRQNPTKKDK
jgi:hypothetical protein